MQTPRTSPSRPSLNAYRAIAQGTKPRKAENWLLRIAHNEVRRHFRDTQGKSREVELDEQLPQTAPERSDPSLADVLRALQHLPPVQRSVLVMREFEGRSYAEIAEIMNITQSALEGQIFRAPRTGRALRGGAHVRRGGRRSPAPPRRPFAPPCRASPQGTSARVPGLRPLRGRAETTACTAEGDFGDADSRLDPSVPGRAGRHRQPGSERHGGGWGRRGRRRGSGRCRGYRDRSWVHREGGRRHGGRGAGGAGYGVATEPPSVSRTEQEVARTARAAPQGHRAVPIATPRISVDQPAVAWLRPAHPSSRKAGESKKLPAEPMAPAKAVVKAKKTAARSERATEQATPKVRVPAGQEDSCDQGPDGAPPA